MEITFNKTEHGYEAEFSVTADFNLHLERKQGGDFEIYQRTGDSGKYAHIDNLGWVRGKDVFDIDFAGLLYPKYIKVVSEGEPTTAVVTVKE